MLAYRCNVKFSYSGFCFEAFNHIHDQALKNDTKLEPISKFKMIPNSNQFLPLESPAGGSYDQQHCDHNFHQDIIVSGASSRQNQQLNKVKISKLSGNYVHLYIYIYALTMIEFIHAFHVNVTKCNIAMCLG